MKPLFVREVTWGQLRREAATCKLSSARPIMIWDASTENLEDVLFGIFHKVISCADINTIHQRTIAVISDVESHRLAIPTLCYAIKKAKRQAATLIPVPKTFCLNRPAPFQSNSVHHFRIVE